MKERKTELLEVKYLVESARQNWPEPRSSCAGCPRAPYSQGEIECDSCTIGYAASLWELFLNNEQLEEIALYKGINLVELMTYPVSRLILRAVRDCRDASRAVS